MNHEETSLKPPGMLIGQNFEAERIKRKTSKSDLSKSRTTHIVAETRQQVREKVRVSFLTHEACFELCDEGCSQS